MEITLMQIKVIRRPNLSSMYPDNSPPIGEKIAVMDANHDACVTDNWTSTLCSVSKGRVVAGYPAEFGDAEKKECNYIQLILLIAIG